MGDTGPFSNGDGGGAAAGTGTPPQPPGRQGQQGSSTQSQHQQPVVGPDMMFKISKKIAQLTKVIYSLNTRNDDLELEVESLRSSYEQRLAEAVAELQRGEADGAENVATPSASGETAANGESGIYRQYILL